MTRARPRLRTQTTGLLYLLQQAGPGGTDAATLAKRARLTPREAAARLRWLQRGRLVRYVADSRRWQLADDQIFPPTKDSE